MSTATTYTGTLRDASGAAFDVSMTVAPHPVTPPGPTPSADGAKATAPGTVLIDDALNGWQLVAVAGQGNTVQWMPHGTTAWVAAGYSANVVELQKWGTTCYQAAVIGGQKEYWSWSGTDWVTAPGDPSAPVVAPPIVVPPANANVTCAFGHPSAKQVSPYVWGFSADAIVVKQYPYTPDFSALLDSTLQFSLAKLKPALLRFNVQQTTPLFQYTFRNGVGSPDWTYVDRWLNTHSGFFNNATGRVVMGIGPIGGDTSISGATFVSWVAPLANYFKAKGQEVMWWELGNECGGSMDNGTYINSYFIPLADALHAVNPAYKCGGPVAPWWDCGGLGAALIAACPGKIGFVNSHMYGGQPGEPQLANPAAMWARALQQEVTAMRSTMRAAGIADSVPTMLGEYNLVLDDSGGANQNATWNAAVFVALTLYTRWANDPTFTMGAIWDLGGFSAAGGYACISNTASHNDNSVITPQGLFLGHAGQIMGGVEAPFSTSLAGLYGIASLNGNKFAIMLMNTGAAQNIVLNMDGRSANGPVARWEVGEASQSTASSTVADLTHAIPVPANQVVILNGTLV